MKKYAFLFAGLTLSACGGGPIEIAATTPYGILLPEGENIADTLDTNTGGQDDFVGGVGSALYRTGAIDGRNTVVSTFFGDSSQGPSPSSNLVFSGNYRVGSATETQTSNDSGSLTLNVNAASGTISGTSDNLALTVDGTFTGNDMGGTVTYQGIDGNLDGVISTSGAVGAFAGANDLGGYAGVLAVN